MQARAPRVSGDLPAVRRSLEAEVSMREADVGRASAAADDRPNPATDAATTLLQRSASGRLKKFNHVIPAVATRLWGDDGRPARRLQNGAAPAEDAALVSLPFRVGSATLAAADDSSGSSILRGAWAGFPSRRVAPGSPSELMLSAKPRSSFEGSPPPRGASRRSRDIPQRPDEMELSGWAGWIPASALEAGSAREDAPRDSPGAHGPSRLGLASPSGPDPALGAAEGSPGVLDRDSAFASLRRGGPSQVEHPKSYLSDDAMGAAKSAEAAFGRARESIETLQPSDAHVLPAAGRAWDQVWRVLMSPAYAVVVLAAAGLFAVERPLSWFLIHGPGARNHNAPAVFVVPTVLVATLLLNSVLFHVQAQIRFKGVQWALARRMMWLECVLSAVLVAVLVVCLTWLPVIDSEHIGHYRTVLMEGRPALALVPGISALHVVAVGLAITSLSHRKLSVRVGGDPLRPSFLASMLLLDLSSYIMLFACIVAWGCSMLGYFATSLPDPVHSQCARLVTTIASQDWVQCGAPCTSQAVQDLNSLYQSERVQVVSARVAMADGTVLNWARPEFQAGRVALAFEFDSADESSAFVFSLDRLYSRVVVIDAAVCAAVLAINLVISYVIRRSIATHLVAPLEACIGALAASAQWLRADGTVAGLDDGPHGISSRRTQADSGKAPPDVQQSGQSGRRSWLLPTRGQSRSSAAPSSAAPAALPTVAQTMQRVLAHLQASVKTAQLLLLRVRVSEINVMPSVGTIPTATDLGLDISNHLPNRETAREADDRALSETDGIPAGLGIRVVKGSPPPPGALTQQPMPSLRGMGMPQRPSAEPKPSTRFDPSIVNKMGTRDWTSMALRHDQLVPAVHAIFMKARIPDSICHRVKFVAWAEKMLANHANLPLHCPRHAVDAMHAVYCALKHPDLAPLPVLCKFALLVAAIALHHASLGVSNAELRRRRHPLDLVYCGQTPQEMASASAAFTTAMSSTDANIFSNLTDADYERVNGLVTNLITESSPEYESRLAQMSVIIKSKVHVANVNSLGEQRDGRARAQSWLHHAGDMELVCLMVLKHADLCYATAQGSAAVAWWDRRVMQELQGQRRRRSDGERVVGDEVLTVRKAVAADAGRLLSAISSACPALRFDRSALDKLLFASSGHGARHAPGWSMQQPVKRRSLDQVA